MILIKYEEAINAIKDNKPTSGYIILCEALDMAVSALEKQIPKKPIIKYGDDTITHNLGRLMCFHCPNCGRYIVALYETDVENGAGIHRDLKGCSTCLQAIDFTGYYQISKLDEDIDFE